MATSSSFKLASRYTYERSAHDEISPPSSPDVAAGDFSHLMEEVSPIDEYDELQSSYYMTGAKPTHAPQNGPPNDAHPQLRPRKSSQWDLQTTNRHSIQHSQPRSHKMHFGSVASQKDACKNATSEDQNMEDGSPHSRQMSMTSPGEVRYMNYQLKPDSEQPAGHWKFPYVTPLIIPQKSSKRQSQFDNAQIIPGRLPSLESPNDAKVAPSVAEADNQDPALRTMWRGSIILSTPSPKSQDHLSDVPGSISERSNSQDAHLALPPTGPAHPSASTFSAQSPFGPRLSPNQANGIKRKPAQRQGSHSPSTGPLHSITPRRASASVILASSERTKSLGQDSAWKRPASRYSAIPHATVNAETSFQPGNEAQPTSLMNRNRSLPNQDELESTLRNLVASKAMAADRQQPNTGLDLSQNEGGPDTKGRHSRSNSQTHMRPASAMSIDKPLPLAPPELSSGDDRIAHLNAVLTGLAHRRVNTIKSIQQMTELMPSDNLLARSDVVKKREMEKKKVEGLKEELYEIQRQEHELGLKLHRAYKRQEREDSFEPTTLWVRRRAGEWRDD